MKRKVLIALGILSICLIASACGSNTASTEQGTEDTSIVQETETQEKETEEVKETESDTSTEASEASQQEAPLPWLKLSSLETHPKLRQEFEEYFDITGETGNKEGRLYCDPVTLDREQNVTLYMATKNYTIACFAGIGVRPEFCEMAAENYTDVEPDDPAAPYATINAYFELLPDAEEGTFNGDETLSRAQAMTLVMRATTPVNEQGAPGGNADFTSAVGESIYTDFAASMNKYSYLNTSNGLNDRTFNSTMTKGEYIVLVTNYVCADNTRVERIRNFGDPYLDISELTLSTVSDAGNISLSEAINDAAKGVPSDMYETFKVAIKNGYLREYALEDWDSALTKADAISLFMEIAINYNCGPGLREQYEVEIVWADAEGEDTPWKKYMAYVRSQGADLALGWCWEYTHGKGAGDQPTYAVYMKEGDPLYGTVYHVGDYVPDGSHLWGTDEEMKEWMKEDMKRMAEEEGLEVTVDEDGEYTIHLD